MRFKNLDLIVAMIFVVISVGWTQISNHPSVIGVVLALPLVFILPGYMVTQTLLRQQSSASEHSGGLFLKPSLKIGQPINFADHIILCLGLSIAIDIVVGFALNILPIGLQRLSWILSLGLIISVFALLVAFLRRKETVKVRGLPRLSISIYKYILFGLALLVATIAIWLSIIRPPDPQTSFTQFWMIPAKNNTCEVLIGIHSFEATSVTYRIVVTSNNVPVTTWSSVALTPQQTWNQSVSIKSQTSNGIYIEARLYRIDKPEIIYREVHMSLNNIVGSGNQKMSC